MISRFNYLLSIALSSSLLPVVSFGADAKSTKQPTSKVPEVTKTDTSAPAPKSVFVIDKDFRDPFFPKSNRPALPETTTTVPATSEDVVSMLRAGFQGIMGAGDDRLAVINNAIIEHGKIVSVPIGRVNSGKAVRVRVIEILKESVVLEVEGQKQPVTLTPPESR